MPKLFCSLICVFFGSLAYAANVTDMYQAQAPVASQSEQERARLAPELLKQVIIKVVGDRHAVEQADITALTTDAERYVEQFSYQQLSPFESTGEPQLALTLEFNASSVTTALQRIGLPIWSNVRPEILLLLVREENGSQQILGEADPNPLLTSLKKAAQKRGLPLMLPLMDLTDQTQLNVSDVSNGEFTAIRKATERYDATIIVTARLTSTAEGQLIHWQGRFGDDTEQWSSQGNAPIAIQNGINELADRLGRRFNLSRSESGESELVIEVLGIQDYEGYSRLMEYLQNLQTVTGIKVGSLGGDHLDLTLNIEGEVEKFKQILSLGRVLSPVENDLTDNQYRFVP